MMKNTTIYSATTFIIASVLYSNLGLAMPAETSTHRLTNLPVASVFSLQAADDERDEEDEIEQCELIFPFCEANRI